MAIQRPHVIFILVCLLLAIFGFSYHNATRLGLPDKFASSVSAHFDNWRPLNCRVETPLVISQDAEWCASKHTGLYDELYRTRDYFQYNMTGPIERNDYHRADKNCHDQGSCVQLKIFKGQLYIGHISENEHCFQSRAESTIMHIYLSLSQGSPNHDIPDLDFWINCSDPPRDGMPAYWQMSKPRSSAESRSRGTMNFFLMPDFNFYAWPEIGLEPWALTFRKTMEAADAMAGKKIHKMLWRGASWTSSSRQKLIDTIEALPQNGTDIADVQNVDWGKMSTVPEEAAKYKTSAQRCEYAYIIYTEGITYSGRMKYALLCNSVMIGPRHNYIEFWTHLLYNESRPAYALVKDDWSNLVETYHKLEADTEQATALAANARQVAVDYLSPEAIRCYTRELMRVYASVCSWTVTDPASEPDHFKPIENYLLPRLRGEQPPGVW